MVYLGEIKRKEINQPKIEKLRDILNKENVSIPTYQRPYCWNEKSIKQLLYDLVFAMEQSKREYRLGNLIIHKDREKNKLNIVDGQQRLTTLSIVLFILEYKETNQLLSSEYESDISVQTILENKKIIEEILKNKSIEFKSNLMNFILDVCEFVYIELNDLSEAFQLFDSQNARGKSLEAYDLLKAFHLREMENDSEQEQLDCVTKWEKYVDNKKINQILGVNLFRIRKWTKNEYGHYFTKDNIDEFKGINIAKYKNYPYLKPYLMNIGLVENIESNSILKMLDNQIEFPFQINQMIINGKYFFKYVYYYAELFDRLFEKNSSDFYLFYENHANYDGSWRQGDKYVKELFQAVILSYYDKFGESDFEKVYKHLYKWVYTLRLKQNSVRYNSIDKYIKENDSTFITIRDSYYHHEVIKNSINKPENTVRAIKEVLNVF